MENFLKQAVKTVQYLAMGSAITIGGINQVFAQTDDGKGTGPLNDVNKTEQKVSGENKKSKFQETIHSLFTSKNKQTIERQEQTLEQQATLLHYYQMQIKALEEKDITNEKGKKNAENIISQMEQDIAEKNTVIQQKEKSLKELDRQTVDTFRTNSRLNIEIAKLNEETERMKGENEKMIATVKQLQNKIKQYENNIEAPEKANLLTLTDTITFTFDGSETVINDKAANADALSFAKDKTTGKHAINALSNIGYRVAEWMQGKPTLDETTKQNLEKMKNRIKEMLGNTKVSDNYLDALCLYIVLKIKQEGGGSDFLNIESVYKNAKNNATRNEKRPEITNVTVIGGQRGEEGIILLQITDKNNKNYYIEYTNGVIIIHTMNNNNKNTKD